MPMQHNQQVLEQSVSNMRSCSSLICPSMWLTEKRKCRLVDKQEHHMLHNQQVLEQNISTMLSGASLICLSVWLTDLRTCQMSRVN